MENKLIKAILNHLWLYESAEVDIALKQEVKAEIRALKPELRFVTKKVGTKLEITRIK